jgi:Domain of unknown function (DUF929)
MICDYHILASKIVEVKGKKVMAKAKRRPQQSSQQRKPAQSTSEAQQRKPVQATAASETTQNRQSQEQRTQQTETSRAQAQAQTRGPRYKQRKSTRNPWLLVGTAVVAIAVVVGIFVFIANQGGNSGGAKPTEASVMQAINKVDPTVLEAVGTGGLNNPLKAAPGKPPKLTGPTGKPQFFYEGAEYCPYCAGQRWAVAVALGRFGQFTKLPETTSTSNDAYPNTATLTFYGSAYSSSYIDFVSLEETTNQSDGNGGYTPLQTPTADQLQLIKTYNTSGGIPFISIANQYLEPGPAYVPDALAGLSQQDIASKLSDSNSTVAKDILGGANYLTASICAVTNNQPASVCTSATIQQIEQSLPKLQGAVQNQGTQLGGIVGPQAMITRRED